MEELYIDDGKLVPQAAWEQTVLSLRASTRTQDARYDEGSDDRPDNPSTNANASRNARLMGLWEERFVTATLERAREANERGQRIGVLFSGGLDSTLIAHVLWQRKISFTCYTVGFQDDGTKEPEDLVEAKRVAARYGWRLKTRLFTLEESRRLIEETAALLGDAANAVTVGVGAVVVAAARLAQQDGTATLFGGLGSEELFAGYERHEHALARGGPAGLDEECWQGLLGMHGRDLVRDTLLSQALNVQLLTPFLDREVIIAAMRLPPTARIKDGQKKHVLREMAMQLGVPAMFALRPKRAAQYGSRFDAALDRLARKAGRKSKGEYINGIISGINASLNARPDADARLDARGERRDAPPKPL